MDTLENLLRRVVTAYADLEHALVATGRHPLAGADGNEGGNGTRVEAPLPLVAEVVEHRHRLIKGLRWWLVDRAPARYQETPALMCAWLLAYPTTLTEQEQEQLRANLHDWLADSWPLLGHTEDAPLTVLDLPAGATTQEVRVADAAAILGCSVRTIRRRVPIEHRPDGKVELWRALPDCPQCDLKVGAGCACAPLA